MFRHFRFKHKILDSHASEKLQKKESFLWWGMIFFTSAILSIQLILWLFSSLAQYGSHSALLLFDLVLIIAIPIILIGWPLLQCFTIYFASRLFTWGFRSGFKAFCILNLILFIVGVLSSTLIMTTWPHYITEAASQLNETKILDTFSRSKSTLAQAQYTITQQDDAIAIPLPEGLLSLTLSGFPAGSLRYGIIPKESPGVAFTSEPAQILPCQRPLFKVSQAQESFSSIFSVVLFGTATHTVYQGSQPYPRELILIREKGPKQADQDLHVSLEVQELTPSIFGTLLYWFVSMLAIIFIMFTYPKLFHKLEAPKSEA